MATYMRLFCLEHFPAHLHPLRVAVSKLQFTRVFPSCSELSCALMLTVRETQPSRKSGFLVCAHVTAEEQIDGSALSACSNDSALGVYVSKTFLLHYELQENMRGTVRPLQLLPLNRIVIGARTKQSFKWASSEKFSSVLLVLASCHKQTLMARQGDVLVLPYHPFLGDDTTQINQYMSDLVVLECTPVTQGMITIHTSVVVSDCRDLLLSHAMLDLFVNPLSRPSNLSLFASDFAHYANSLGPGSSLLNNKLLISSGFTGFLQALECRLDVKVVDVVRLYRQGKLSLRVEQGAEVDTDSMIFVSKNLLLKLGLFNGEWVVSALCPPLGKGKKSSRTELVQSPGGAENESISKFTAKARGDVHLAKIMAFNWDRFTDMDAGDNVGFISPVQWFNMSNGEPIPVGNKAVKIKRWNQAPSETRLKLSASACCSAAPSYAKELHIEAVISPDYNSYGPFDDILFKHFTTPRLVQQGLMLGIPVQGCPEFVESSTDGVTRWPVLYFKVKQVTGFSEEEGEVACYLADTDHTSLYMRGSTNSLAPCSILEVGPSFWTCLSPPALSSTVEQLVTIIQPHLTERCAFWKRGCSVLLVGPNGSGKVTAIKAACRRLHLHLLKVDCVTLCGDTAAACESKMKAVFHKAELHHPCVLLLRNLQLLSQRRDGTEMDSRVVSALCQLIADSHSRVIVVGTVSDQRDVFADVMAAFVHQVAMESHSEEQRKAILTSLTEDITLAKDASLAKIAKQTAGFVLGDFCALLTSAGKAAHQRLMTTYYPHGASAQEEEDLCVCGVTIMAADFTKALESLQEAHSQAIGAPKIPSVRWQDVGGLQHVKKEILDTIQLPLEHPELLSLDLRRSGLLLYGPPGTGKTLLAKAVATECSMTFLSVKGPEVINMYVGQSEENIREVFSKARAAAPCIVFFDELDSLAPNRGRSGDSGGVMDRVVSQLLAELDGLHSSSDVFVIGATNRPDLLDHSLLRPGRFDKLVYVGINEDRESQLQVLKAIVRKFKVDPTVNLSDIVEQCPPQLTGADVYALCSDAMMFAIKRKILRISEGLESEDSVLTLCAEDFSQALDVLQPSVSEQELHKYKLIQQKFTTK
ncbi:peroxisome assembly factor 2 [Pygocentrus nattereri]|uniref:Peroxisomal ATPase PEX6 n=1 Tax=Pygocentrus nattereri TaxID=42514 RepID=A0AAR2J2E3_PYGNA|nr:peroxisome assembly factor 2 [Pygocentrus nattereri]